MDYIFRWLQMRFLTGQQQMLFENLRLKAGGAAGPERRRRRQLERGRGVGRQKPGAAAGIGARLGCTVLDRRLGRRTQLPLLRSHHDAQWELLPLHVVRLDVGMQLGLAVFLVVGKGLSGREGPFLWLALLRPTVGSTNYPSRRGELITRSSLLKRSRRPSLPLEASFAILPAS